ncbi:hypothetical protein [Nonomuraea endophytica]|uniref:Uncharacterized protein n=1 Tax=Nonomuraea endophytica TaxID=714136 RepID=A0A7W8AA12_9ACTN|nr:hypothetical protein [Nonomuraea endophytica]MBB5081336.1 hypothetical protein [Nonomuraea endophytica]
MKALKEAPYDRRGNLMHYPQDDYRRVETGEYAVVPPDWRPITEFTATLTMTGRRRGRSAAYFMWTDQDGHEWPMFLADLDHLISSATIKNGVATGTWTVGKRGANFGIRYVSQGEGSA